MSSKIAQAWNEDPLDVVVAFAVAAGLVSASLLVTVVIYWGQPVETDPLLSILWPWAAGAATVLWGVPFAKRALSGDRRQA